MSTGNCFHCHQPGHWANSCPLKTTTKPTSAAAAASLPVIHCPCNAGACNILTSKTEKNPNRRFYTCPSCKFFKWCDQVSIKSEPISDLPTCPCGAGPCKRVTVIDGPNAQRSYFVCCIKKGFGDCGFFKWEDDVQIQPESEQVENDGFSGFDESLLHETELDSDGNVKRNRLGVVVESELNPTSSSESTTLGNRVADTLPMNAVTVGKESIPVFAGFNNQESVSNGVVASANGIVPSFDLITLYDDVVRLETEEQVLTSVAPKHLDPQVEVSCGKDSYASEGVAGHSQNKSDLVSNGSNKPEHLRATISGETEASFSGSSSMMELIEQYNSEKLCFESISMKHVEALTAYTGSYKRLESLRGRARSLKKQLLEVEKQVKLCEAETSEFAASLKEVSGEMAKSQKKMVETAGKVAKEVRVNKPRD
ncbi:Zinc finger CCHC-type [Arabidopsis thaliana x Arabidopsis arenosa]|uniref:Zinc finger CCHC-type n=1 Tax=Arabidopsis thaliana x Arabidopsis arenosa TaxID=1240361 RepID=A0A8T2BDW6_9BRAS|nr:Zinc finger CCHC-type [Arabidopsis thaliana x Arabidopsis arenosa]